MVMKEMENKNKLLAGRLTSENAICDFCQQSYSCGVLKTALEILDKETQNTHETYPRELFLDFRKKLQRLGYVYPQAKELCWLSDKGPIISDLADEATRIISEVRSRKKDN